MCTTRDFVGQGTVASAGLSIFDGLSATRVHLHPDGESEITINNFQTDYSITIGASLLYGPFMLGWEN
jgi:hypothetical protein